MITPHELRDTITACAVMPPKPTGEIPGEHPVAAPLAYTHAVAEAAPFIALLTELDEYFAPFATAPLDEPFTEAEMRRIIAAHCHAASDRIHDGVPIGNSHDVDFLHRLAAAAVNRAADLRFTQMMGQALINLGCLLSYQTAEQDGSIGGATIRVGDIWSLGHADAYAKEAAGNAQSVMVTHAITHSGVDLIAHWEQQHETTESSTP